MSVFLIYILVDFCRNVHKTWFSTENAVRENINFLPGTNRLDRLEQNKSKWQGTAKSKTVKSAGFLLLLLDDNIRWARSIGCRLCMSLQSITLPSTLQAWTGKGKERQKTPPPPLSPVLCQATIARVACFFSPSQITSQSCKRNFPFWLFQHGEDKIKKKLVSTNFWKGLLQLKDFSYI